MVPGQNERFGLGEQFVGQTPVTTRLSSDESLTTIHQVA